MKPRLFKRAGLWVCFTFVGMLRVTAEGTTPQEAFANWKARRYG